MTRAFFVVTDSCDQTGFAVVAGNLQAAKETVRQREMLDDEELDGWEIDGADVENFPEGVVEGITGLKRGLYSWVDDTCPVCNKVKTLTVSEEEGIVGLICCYDCVSSKINELIAEETC